MRICIAYDCLYPYTVGGAERWYRRLAKELAAAGHEVDYLTLRQWSAGEPVSIPGVNVIAVGPAMALYVGARRGIRPPLRFGVGVFMHLARHPRRYDIVHLASFPYFSLLAAGSLLPIARYRIVVDWHEVWTRAYWRAYVGAFRGGIGWRVQWACTKIPQQAFCFAQLHAGRLQSEGFRGPVTVLRGQYAGEDHPRLDPFDPPAVVFAGRHIPEKRVTALVPAIALAREALPELRGAILGDGPDRALITQQVADFGLEDVVEVPGFVPDEQVEIALRQALCLVLPSRREGYGLIVVEAAAAGTPVVVVADADNAAVELVDDGVNGVISPSASPEDVCAAILRIADGGVAMRESTASWFDRHRGELSLATSVETVLARYGAIAHA